MCAIFLASVLMTTGLNSQAVWLLFGYNWFTQTSAVHQAGTIFQLTPQLEQGKGQIRRYDFSEDISIIDSKAIFNHEIPFSGIPWARQLSGVSKIQLSSDRMLISQPGCDALSNFSIDDLPCLEPSKTIEIWREID